MTAIAIITVMSTADDLDEDDGDVEGVYGVRMGDGPGDHPSEPRDADRGGNPLEEAALDAFHDRVAIGVLDDFEISVAIMADGQEASGDVRWL